MLTAITAVLVFLVVITIHELGHFLVAKSVGIKVNEFAIGMGPKIFESHKGETKYSLRLLPIGGYVSMEGEDEDSDDKRAFNNVSVWKRLAVVLAGAMMNFLLAIIILSGIYTYYGVPTTTVGELLADSPAASSDLQAGDRIIEINGMEINTWEDIQNSIGKSTTDSNLSINVIRNNQEKNIEIKPVVEDGRTLIGIAPKYKMDFIQGIKSGFTMTYNIIQIMFEFIGNAFRGKVGLNDFSGPVGVVSEIGKAAKTGVQDVLMLLALININLGFFNLLPIPALDGGRAFFMFIELLRGKPLPAEKEGFVHFVGFILLMSLVVVVSFKDVIKLW